VTTLSLSAMLPDAQGLIDMNGEKFSLFGYLAWSQDSPNKRLMDFFRYDAKQNTVFAVCMAKDIADIEKKLDNENLTDLFQNKFVYKPNYAKKRWAFVVGTTDISVVSKIPKQ
jgi:hypothetical protein